MNIPIAESKPAFSSTESGLSFHLMTDEDRRQAEAAYPGWVELVMVRRYHVRLRVGSHGVWNFYIDQTRSDEKNLQLLPPYTGFDETKLDDRLWKLAWHHATRALLALRRGHAEARLESQERKAQRAKKAKAAVP